MQSRTDRGREDGQPYLAESGQMVDALLSEWTNSGIVSSDRIATVCALASGHVGRTNGRSSRIAVAISSWSSLIPAERETKQIEFELVNQ
jgi:hypothetical protein